MKRDLFRPLTIGLQIRKWKGHGEGGFDWAPPPSVRAFASAAKVGSIHLTFGTLMYVKLRPRRHSVGCVLMLLCAVSYSDDWGCE